MKYFSFRILFLCIALPPFIHLATVQSLETYLRNQYKEAIENTYLGDTRPLFSGDIRLRDAVNNNIDRFLARQPLIKWGAKTEVLVTTKQNSIIYPNIFAADEDSLMAKDRRLVAADNYRLMNEGLLISVNVTLQRSSLLVILMFSSFYFVSLLFLYRHYRIGYRKAVEEERNREKEIARLLEIEKQHSARLAALREDKQFLAGEFQRIKKKLEHDKLQATRNEDEMIEEMIALEAKFQNTLKLYDEQQKENESLKEIIRQYEKMLQKTDKQRDRTVAAVQKRFKMLYKNVLFQQRAYQGVADLPEDMKIKVEEVIQHLQTDPALVPVKRKVMMKRNPKAILEVTFSYNGRLYYRKTRDNHIEILAVGTKNTQNKDLAYLDGLDLPD
ncbi:MAG: hypothetical protein ACOZF0_18760 [Thermodesulfobacteriota bacterium]